jgi:hypothetical protein
MSASLESPWMTARPLPNSLGSADGAKQQIPPAEQND